LAAIRAGVAPGLIQVNLAKRDPDLVHLSPDSFELGFDVWLVTHEDLQHVQRVRLVFDALADGLTDYLA
jgi:DNA-binding transcriptional LysR family regulator